jgi:hypothetical protein
MKVDHALAVAALEQHGGRAPSNPDAELHLSEPDEHGVARLTWTGDAHASGEAILASLGLAVAEPRGRVTSRGRPEFSQAFLSAEPGQRDRLLGKQQPEEE